MALATKGVAAVAKPASALITPMTSVELLLFLLVVFVPIVYPFQSSNIWAIKKVRPQQETHPKKCSPIVATQSRPNYGYE